MNILVCGTPATGKSLICSNVVDIVSDFRYVEVNEVIKQECFYSRYDEEFECFMIEQGDEDRLLDYLEPIMEEGNNIVEYHSCEFFPERWFDLVLVLRADNTVLYDRLVERGYPIAKVQENVESEIMEVVLEEARRSYREDIVIPLTSNTNEDAQDNIRRIVEWIGLNKR